MSAPTSSHAYGIGVIALIIGMGVTIVFYTSFYLPEQMALPSVEPEILEAETFNITIIPGAVNDDGNDYEPKNAKIILGVSNKVLWTNQDDIAHTVTPPHRYEDSYSGIFESPGVIKPGETFEFLFTEAGTIEYQCLPHPWMTGSITIEKNRF